MNSQLPRLFHAFRATCSGVIRPARGNIRPTLSWTLRLTVSAVAAYVVVGRVYPDSDPLLAPLTALLVTQLTLFSVVRHGLDRMLSVLTGVIVAVIFSSVIGLSWWSLGLLIAASLLLGVILRVGPNLIEVPISAMLVLGVGAGNTDLAAVERIMETVVGAFVGMIVNLIVPPGVRVRSAGAGIEHFADEIAGTLDEAAERLPDGISADNAAAWLRRARNFSNLTPGLDGALVHAEESRVLNIRAITSPDIGSTLRTGLDTLEHSSVAVRSLFRAVNDLAHFPDDGEQPLDITYPPETRQMTAMIFESLAGAIREFGVVVHAQLDEPGQVELTRLHAQLDQLFHARNKARDLFRTDSAQFPLVHELNVFVVATAGRILRELDPRSHTWMTTAVVADTSIRLWRRRAG